MNVDTMTRRGRKAVKRIEKQGERIVGEVAGASEKFASRAADRSERAFKSATKAAERSLADLMDAASELYDERKDDAEVMVRDAVKSVGKSVGNTANSLVAMLPSERRRRRRRYGMLGAVALVGGIVGYRYWKARRDARDDAPAQRDGESQGSNNEPANNVADISRSTAGS
ncbi:MAG: hypothetical protein WD156_00540 [Acidimicrobiia bacterium]